MDTKSALNPACERGQYLYTIVDLYSKFMVTVATPENFAYCAVNS